MEQQQKRRQEGKEFQWTNKNLMMDNFQKGQEESLYATFKM